MIKLNDYLYDGDTVLHILHRYRADLHANALQKHNEIDMLHANFLLQITDLLEHNEFLTAQSERIHEFYQYMVKAYPELAFIFKGRIKSLIRAEEKFNGKIVQTVYSYYAEHGEYPPMSLLRDKLRFFRDLIAYRIVISMPKCHLAPGENKVVAETRLVYDIANHLVSFMEARGFTAEVTEGASDSPLLSPDVRHYYRDYITRPTPYGYQSLHITFYDNNARCYLEMQLRTKDMDDCAEIGLANHLGYEKRQETERMQRSTIPVGECIYFDEAYERGIALQQLELAGLDVNMFAATNNTLINDSCGLYRGRLILPYEHLSRFQTDSVGI